MQYKLFIISNIIYIYSYIILIMTEKILFMRDEDVEIVSNNMNKIIDKVDSML